jgi:hypothetical protein
MRNQTTKQKRNAGILNVLKTLDYKPKERIYAPLIIEILEAANNFDKKLNNCVVEHTIIDKIIYDKWLSFIGDEFGRSNEELGKRFIAACENLYNTFKKNHPDVDDFDKAKTWKYFTIGFTKERNFIRRLVLKISTPLELKRVKQQIFVDANVYKKNKKELSLTWTSGTRGGNYIMGEEYALPRLVTKKEIELITILIEKDVNKNNCEMPSYEKVEEIIEFTLSNKLSKL